MGTVSESIAQAIGWWSKAASETVQPLRSVVAVVVSACCALGTAATRFFER